MRINFIIVLLLLITTHTVAKPQQPSTLPPEEARLLAINVVDKERIKQNAYVSLLVIDAPINADYQSIAEKIVINNQVLLNKAIKTQDSQFAKKILTPESYLGKNYSAVVKMPTKVYQFPCFDLKKQHCIAEVLVQKKQFNKSLAANQQLLARYEKMVQLPYYDTYNFIAEAKPPPYHIMMYLSQLRLAKAIFLIEDGQVETALVILQQEVAFGKLMLQGNSYMIDEMVAVRQLLTVYHVIAELLDKPQIANYLNHAVWQTLLQPFSSVEQQALLLTLINNERKFNVISFYLYSKKTILEEVKQASWLYNDPRAELIAQAIKKGYPLNYNNSSSINLNYQQFDNFIELVKVSPTDFVSQYKQAQQKNQKMPNIVELYKQYGDDNLLGGILLEASNMFGGIPYYIASFYDMTSYLALVNIKLQIKQAAINKEQVADFLTKQADKAVNPYFNKPFVWNVNNQQLTTDWMATDTNSSLGKKANLYIDFSK